MCHCPFRAQEIRKVFETAALVHHPDKVVAQGFGMSQNRGRSGVLSNHARVAMPKCSVLVCPLSKL